MALARARHLEGTEETDVQKVHFPGCEQLWKAHGFMIKASGHLAHNAQLTSRHSENKSRDITYTYVAENEQLHICV